MRAAIAKGLSFLRRSKPGRHAGAYLHPDGFILFAQHRATSGVLLSAPPVVRLGLDTSAGALGIALRQVLEAYQEGVPHPGDWREAAATMLEATGYRSWRALEGPARCCWIVETQTGFVFTPLRNGGSRGDQKGFQPFGAEPIGAAIDATDEQLGETLKAALVASQ